MAFLYDYIPVVFFFIIYKLYGLFIATKAVMIFSFVQMSLYWLKHRKFEKTQTVLFIIIFLLGSATLIWHNSFFIELKPTLVYWFFSLMLFISHFIGEKPLVSRAIKDKFHIPLKIHYQINLAWAIFFFLLGALNLYVLKCYPINLWINFNVFGILILTLIFVVLQGLYLAYKLKKNKPK
jgi:intracellular septation protein